MSVFIIAEAGGNHDGSLDRAKKLVDIAVEAKADAVKFQLIPPFKPEWVDILISYCGSRIEFMATPFNQNGIDALREKVKHWKIASPEATDEKFVQSVLMATGKNDVVLISDGCVDSLEQFIQLDDWSDALKIVRMSCVVKYPAQEEDYHFYDGIWGLSDHTESLLLPVMAVSHGATYIEKHFTDDRTRVGPDHAFALEPTKLKDMVSIIRLTEKILSNKKLTIKEPERHLSWP